MSAYTTNISLSFGSNFSEAHINRSRSGAQVGRSSSLTASHHTKYAPSRSVELSFERAETHYSLRAYPLLGSPYQASEKPHPYIISILCISGCHALLSRLTWDSTPCLGVSHAVSSKCAVFLGRLNRRLDQMSRSSLPYVMDPSAAMPRSLLRTVNHKLQDRHLSSRCIRVGGSPIMSTKGRAWNSDGWDDSDHWW